MKPQLFAKLRPGDRIQVRQKPQVGPELIVKVTSVPHSDDTMVEAAIDGNGGPRDGEPLTVYFEYAIRVVDPHEQAVNPYVELHQLDSVLEKFEKSQPKMGALACIAQVPKARHAEFEEYMAGDEPPVKRKRRWLKLLK
jgi:hypothetical protein